MANNLTEGFMYELPSNTTRVGDVLFGTPMQYTGGLYINVFLIGFFSMLTIGSLNYNIKPAKSLVYSTFGTFGLTFLLSLAGYAGGNQLIPAAVAFIAVTAFNIVLGEGGGPV